MKKSNTVKNDFIASLVVFLIALPLSLGIALASGAPAKSAIIAAIIGGVLVGALSGAPLQVSGPAAGLSVLVFGLIQNLGLEKTFLAVAIAGILQVIFGLLKVSRLSLAIAPSVIHGMLAGIGVLIAMGQAHVVLGSSPRSSGLQNILGYAESFQNMNAFALVLGVSSFLIIVFWKKLLPKVAALIPGSLISVVVLTAITLLMGWDVSKVQLDDDVLGLQNALFFPDSSDIPAILVAALTLFAVASAESLLCALATDKLHSGKRANLDKELIAQGVGNFTSGALGGLPITGVIVRSAANISSGGKTRLSAILHGVWVLLFVALGKDLIKEIPLAVLAGLLIHVGVNLVKMDDIKHLKHYRQHWIYFATLFGVVFFGLLNGIGIGLALTFGILMLRLSHIEFKEVQQGEKKTEITIKGALTFLSAPSLSKKLSEVPAGHHIHLHLAISELDITALEMIRDWRKQYESMGGTVTKPNLDDMMKSKS